MLSMYEKYNETYFYVSKSDTKGVRVPCGSNKIY